MKNFISLWVEFLNPPKSLKSWFLIPSSKCFYPEVIEFDGSLWVKTNIEYYPSGAGRSFCLESNGWQGLTYCFHSETGDFDPDFKSMQEGCNYQQVGSHKIKINGITPNAWFELENKLYFLKKLGEYEYSISIDPHY